MSHTRKIALVLLLAVAAIGGLQQSSSATAIVVDETPAMQLASGFTLVKGWCGDICATSCAGSGDCLDSRTVGCTCYWVCGNQEEGSQICTGAIGVKICDL